MVAFIVAEGGGVNGTVVGAGRVVGGVANANGLPAGDVAVKRSQSAAESKTSKAVRTGQTHRCQRNAAVGDSGCACKSGT